MKANLEVAVDLCRLIEEFAPMYGCHVALTGGCLYKNGDRKDMDILFYRIRQVPYIDMEGLLKALEAVGFDIKPDGFGWIYKATYKGIDIDMFFPEEDGGHCYSCGGDHDGDCPTNPRHLLEDTNALIDTWNRLFNNGANPEHMHTARLLTNTKENPF